jgi:hypothetical protein
MLLQFMMQTILPTFQAIGFDHLLSIRQSFLSLHHQNPIINFHEAKMMMSEGIDILGVTGDSYILWKKNHLPIQDKTSNSTNQINTITQECVLNNTILEHEVATEEYVEI